ncbi:hypothetical protein JCM24511_04232 [Saitozyma sp. JCM 24511]|nr:hypothetical protein JCM24511_04232 [Saitozyma sp. JCM 24511]
MATDPNLFRRLAKAAEFASYPVTRALEARIEGHPATNVTDDRDDPPSSPTFGLSRGDVLSADGPGLIVGGLRNAFTASTWPDILPDRHLSDRLVQAFFATVQPNFPIFHRGNFHVKYETLWSSSRAAAVSTQDWESGWTWSFMMVAVLGALSMEGPGLAEAAPIQQRYLSLVIKHGLPRLTMTSSIANVQALMLLALYQHNVGERNTAWNIVGQATRMAISIGLHRDGDTAHFDPVERNIRRMVWWTLYEFEQMVSLILGRPACTDSIDMSARMPDEDFVDGIDRPPGYVAQVVALMEQATRVRRFVASISSSWDQPQTLLDACSCANDLNHNLNRWQGSLPPHLQPQAYSATNRHRRAVLLLHVMFEHIRSVLGRPFLLCRVNQEVESQSGTCPPVPQPVQQLALLAEQAGKMSLGRLHDLATQKLLDSRVWIDMFYLHHAIYILCVPYLSRAVDADPLSPDIRRLIKETMAAVEAMIVAPTYRLLLRMAAQIAFAVGLGPEVEERGLHPVPPIAESGNVPTLEKDVGTISQTFNIDQIFGPLPSRPASPRDPFAALHDFGLGNAFDTGDSQADWLQQLFPWEGDAGAGVVELGGDPEM